MDNMQGPLSVVELRQGDVRLILAMESAEEVREIVNRCEERLCTLTRWTFDGVSEFHTRPDNVIAIRENK